MENLKIKKSKGRPRFLVENIKDFQKLCEQIDRKEITNQEGWKTIGCGKTKWYELKKLYYNQKEVQQ